MENKNHNNPSVKENKGVKEVVIDSHTACCKPRSAEPCCTPSSSDDSKDVCCEQPEDGSACCEK